MHLIGLVERKVLLKANLCDWLSLVRSLVQRLGDFFDVGHWIDEDAKLMFALDDLGFLVRILNDYNRLKLLFKETFAIFVILCGGGNAVFYDSLFERGG